MSALVIFLERYGPSLLGALGTFIAGVCAAGYIQGVRLQACVNHHQEVVNEQARRALEAEQAALARADESARAWAANLDALRARYRAGWVPQLPAESGSGLRVPPAPGIDGAGKNPVPAPRGAPAQVLADCAEVTLQLNTLQSDIQKQMPKD